MRHNEFPTPNYAIIIVDTSALLPLLVPLPPEFAVPNEERLRNSLQTGPDPRLSDGLLFLSRRKFQIIIPEMVAYEAARILHDGTDVSDYFPFRWTRLNLAKEMLQSVPDFRGYTHIIPPDPLDVSTPAVFLRRVNETMAEIRERNSEAYDIHLIAKLEKEFEEFVRPTTPPERPAQIRAVRAPSQRYQPFIQSRLNEPPAPRQAPQATPSSPPVIQPEPARAKVEAPLPSPHPAKEVVSSPPPLEAARPEGGEKQEAASPMAETAPPQQLADAPAAKEILTAPVEETPPPRRPGKRFWARLENFGDIAAYHLLQGMPKPKVSVFYLSMDQGANEKILSARDDMTVYLVSPTGFYDAMRKAGFLPGINIRDDIPFKQVFAYIQDFEAIQRRSDIIKKHHFMQSMEDHWPDGSKDIPPFEAVLRGLRRDLDEEKRKNEERPWKPPPPKIKTPLVQEATPPKADTRPPQRNSPPPAQHFDPDRAERVEALLRKRAQERIDTGKKNR